MFKDLVMINVSLLNKFNKQSSLTVIDEVGLGLILISFNSLIENCVFTSNSLILSTLLSSN